MKPVAGLVFDPQGDGTPDYKDYVDRAFDGNPDSAWLTWVYKGQFPSLKTGVGLLLELERETTPTSVTVNSATNGTVVEIRSAASPTTPFDQTTVLGYRHRRQRHRDHPVDRGAEVQVPDRVRHQDVADLGQSVPVQDQRGHRSGQLTARRRCGTRAETGRGIFVGTVALSGLERRNRARTVDFVPQHRHQY